MEMGRAGGGCGRRRWEASPLAGSRATEHSSESSCGGQKGEMRVRVGVQSQRGVLIGVSRLVVGRAASGMCHYWAMQPTVLHGPG
jgi:hypothetical protein